MVSWMFYPAFVGTAISIVAWTYLAYKEHLRHLPRTLSELASENPKALRYYQIVLWACGPLFAITLLGFIAPRTSFPIFISIMALFVVTPEILIGFFPAQRGKITSHDIIAAVMGASMISLGFVFAWTLPNFYAEIEFMFGLIMSWLGILCLIDRNHYLFYELPLIYLSHFSILIAALAVR